MVGLAALKALFALLARVILAWVFINAGLPKIQDPLGFAASIEAYRVISGQLVLWVALILPWFELAIGIGLLTPWLKRGSAWAMAGLLGVFVALHALSWARGLDINCGCFGQDADSPDYHWLILRNLGLLVLVIYTLFYRGKELSRRSAATA